MSYVESFCSSERRSAQVGSEIRVQAQIDTDDLTVSLCENLSVSQLVNFVISLDEYYSDWGFTYRLIVKLCNSILSDNKEVLEERINLQIDTEKISTPRDGELISESISMVEIMEEFLSKFKSHFKEHNLYVE